MTYKSGRRHKNEAIKEGVEMIGDASIYLLNKFEDMKEELGVVLFNWHIGIYWSSSLQINQKQKK